MKPSWIRAIAATLFLLLTATASLAGTDDKEPVWHKRSGTASATKEEELAMELVTRGEQMMKRGRYVVLYDGERGEYTQVSVHLPGEEGGVNTISRFLVKGGKIVAYADTEYAQPPRKVDPRRRENALMIARQTQAGEAPIRPEIYDGFMYTAVITNCMAVVTEKNTDREVVETYEFNLCK